MFYHKQIVKIESNDPELNEVNGKMGEIVGKTDPYSDASVDYGVFVFDLQEVWQIHERWIVESNILNNH